MEQIKAKDDNVFVRFLPIPKTVGSIIVPDTAKQEKTLRAEVIAVGPGHYDRGGRGPFIPTTVQVGDVVLVDRKAGQDYCLDNYKPRQNKGSEFSDGYGDIRIVREDEILGVEEPDGS